MLVRGPLQRAEHRAHAGRRDCPGCRGPGARGSSGETTFLHLPLLVCLPAVHPLPWAPREAVRWWPLPSQHASAGTSQNPVLGCRRPRRCREKTAEEAMPSLNSGPVLGPSCLTAKGLSEASASHSSPLCQRLMRQEDDSAMPAEPDGNFPHPPQAGAAEASPSSKAWGMATLKLKIPDGWVTWYRSNLEHAKNCCQGWNGGRKAQCHQYQRPVQPASSYTSVRFQWPRTHSVIVNATSWHNWLSQVFSFWVEYFCHLVHRKMVSKFQISDLQTIFYIKDLDELN